jgi:hypothetical protein
MTPWDEGFKRAAWNAITTFAIAFLFTALVQYQMALTDMTMSDNEKIKNAVIFGLVAAFTPLAAGSAWAHSDQKRADNGTVISSDVPVQIAARHKKTTADQVVASNFPREAA